MRLKLLTLALLLSSSVAHAAGSTGWITWTYPCWNARQAWVVDPETGDSIATQLCEPGTSALTDLAKVRIWRWPITGGLATIWRERSALGLQCRADSELVPVDAHYYLTTLDFAGNQSCQSNTVYVLGTVTSVEPSPTADRIAKVLVFDVQGRLLSGPLRASGIYFFRTLWRSGRITSGRLPPLIR